MPLDIPLAGELTTINGLPAHPLLVHLVVVLLPLAAGCAVLVSLHHSTRRRYGLAVLVLTAVGVGVVPLVTDTGEQLRDRLPSPQNPDIARHAQLGDQLLPYALSFGVATVLLYVAGKLADRERAAQLTAGSGKEPATTVTRTWRRVAVVASVLVIATATATTVQVVRIGDAGATAVWKGVGKT